MPKRYTISDIRAANAAADVWREYDGAAEWCARRGLKGQAGDPLPNLMSRDAVDAINDDPEAFEDRVKGFAYAMAMDGVLSTE
jgi:hypothetical protein